MIVILEDDDSNSLTHQMDRVTLAIPFQQTDTTIQLQEQRGVNGIAEFSVSYSISCDTDPDSSADLCEVPSTSVLISPTTSFSCTSCD